MLGGNMAIPYSIEADGQIIQLFDLPEHLQQLGIPITLPSTAAPSVPQETEQLRAALECHHWNITAVARELQLHRSTIYRQMQRFGVRTGHR